MEIYPIHHHLITTNLESTTLIPAMIPSPNKLAPALTLTSTLVRARSQSPCSSHSLLVVHLRDPARHSTQFNIALHMSWIKRMRLVTLNNRYEKLPCYPGSFQLTTRSRLVAMKTMVSQHLGWREIHQSAKWSRSSFLSFTMSWSRFELDYQSDRGLDLPEQCKLNDWCHQSKITTAKEHQQDEGFRSFSRVGFTLQGRISDTSCHDIYAINYDLIKW